MVFSINKRSSLAHKITLQNHCKDPDFHTLKQEVVVKIVDN